MKKRFFLLLTIVLALTGCKEDLYSNLSEADANEMVAILLNNGIDAQKISVKGEFGVAVDRSQIAESVYILKEHGFPRKKFVTMGDIFAGEGLISSPLEERVRFVYALSQNVEEALSQIDGVITARVLVNLPENDPFAETIIPSSASVFIKHHYDANIDRLKSQIKMFVEQSIEGLDYEQVNLLLSASSSRPAKPEPIPWDRNLGLKLAPDSVGLFWILLGFVSLLITSSAGGCGYLIWRERKKLKQDERSFEESAKNQSLPNDSVVRLVNG